MHQWETQNSRKNPTQTHLIFKSFFTGEVFIGVDSCPLHAQNPVANVLDHVQLLQDRVHVAGRSGVFQADEAPGESGADGGKVFPFGQGRIVSWK